MSDVLCYNETNFIIQYWR